MNADPETEIRHAPSLPIATTRRVRVRTRPDWSILILIAAILSLSPILWSVAVLSLLCAALLAVARLSLRVEFAGIRPYAGSDTALRVGRDIRRRLGRRGPEGRSPSDQETPSEPWNVIAESIGTHAPDRVTDIETARMRHARAVAATIAHGDDADIREGAFLRSSLADLVGSYRRPASIACVEEMPGLASQLADTASSIGEIAERTRRRMLRNADSEFQTQRRYVDAKLAADHDPLSAGD